MTTQHHAFARSDRSRMGVWWWTTDHILLGATTILIAIGVLLSFANSPAAAERLHLPDPFHFAVRQSFFALGALIVLLVVSMLSPRGVKRSAFFIYAASIAIMIALPLMGHHAKGATRWLEFGGFSLQPSEFMKPTLIVLASWMFAEGQKGEGVPGVSIAFVLYGVSVALLLLQPDVGQTVLITLAFGACFFMAGVPLAWIIGLGVFAGAGGLALYFAFDHVSSRINGFLSHDTAAGHADPNQIKHALEAIAAGGWFGQGPGEAILKRQIPDVQTDFAYAGGAEEYGLLFSLFLISLFAALVLRGLYKSMKLSDPFDQVAAGGLFVLVGQQVFINIAMELKMIPTKGMTLPFISYGGSSMLAMGLTLGMALALTRKRPGAYTPAEGSAGAFGA
jgi:cell division protein FtsW